ncbi:MAG: thioredoxin family protein [Gramella sp.]|nr:thioredoxin family protein [Christiangramia sp.]
MSKILILIAAITLSCGNTLTKTTPTEDIKSAKAEEDLQKNMLIGEFKKEDLQQKPFESWFAAEYESYSPQPDAMETIRENIADYEIKVLMGTWCGDSKREVPRLIKLLDEANYDYNKIEMVGVDRNKTTPSKIEEELDVHHVPTIIFYQDGKEVNRFVEYAQGENLEEDIAKIISGAEYKNSYAD